MPRATWRGFLRLSLVTCPVYLSPATTGTKPIRLHQVWCARSRRRAWAGHVRQHRGRGLHAAERVGFGRPLLWGPICLGRIHAMFLTCPVPARRRRRGGSTTRRDMRA